MARDWGNGLEEHVVLGEVSLYASSEKLAIDDAEGDGADDS